jgi:hypothetical protein
MTVAPDITALDATAFAATVRDLAGLLAEETAALAAMDTGEVARLAPLKQRLAAEYERLGAPVIEARARTLAEPERGRLADAMAELRRAVTANERALAAATTANARLLKAVAAGVQARAVDAAGYNREGERPTAPATRAQAVRVDQTL